MRGPRLDTFFPRLAAEADAGFDCASSSAVFNASSCCCLGRSGAPPGATPPPEEARAGSDAGRREADLTPAVRPEDEIFNRPQGGRLHRAGGSLTPGGAVPLTPERQRVGTPRLGASSGCAGPRTRVCDPRALLPASKKGMGRCVKILPTCARRRPAAPT